MSCADFRAELKRWLETTLETEHAAKAVAPQRAREHAERCETCAAKLRAAEALLGISNLRAETPPFLVSGILRTLAGRKPGWKKSKTWLIGFPSAAMVILALLLTLLFGRNGGVVVRFTLAAPMATKVHVVGDWNGWNPDAHPLTDDNGDGIWETEIKLHPGKEYRYQFYIDKEIWIADPDAPLAIEDGFGGVNSILRI